ncbi:MAG: Rne/Rng family ribonuclease [Deltaproteobacteria bacterium]|nr:Rne/Rng family ribonuclease [Deltaproteobacteria bacterium]
MSKILLINTINREELRAAVVENQKLLDLEIESAKNLSKKGNIYKGVVTRVEGSLQAGFIDIGLNRNGFLQIQELNDYLLGMENRRGRLNSSYRHIRNYLSAGKEILVQIVKDETESKGAMLTMNLAIPGKYTVLLIGSSRKGVSKRIKDKELNQRFNAALEQLKSELDIDWDSFGIIARSSAGGRTVAELVRDIKLCFGKWQRIKSGFENLPAPSLLYSEAGFPTRVVREYFSGDIQQIIVDSEAAFNEIKDFIEETMPRYRNRLKFYDSDVPLFTQYGIEEEVQKTFHPVVELSSGGFLVIEPLESIVAIDVNSGKAKAGQDFETNAFITNLEAVEEVARQLRLRDLGGLIIVDLIDMKNPRNIKEVERRLKLAVSLDKARVEVGEISKFGLIELSRQRIRSSVNSQLFSKCPYCLGTGKVRGPELVALDVIRKVQSAVASKTVKSVTVRIALVAGLYLLNFRKKDLSNLETKYNCDIIIVPEEKFRPDEFQIDLIEREKESLSFAEIDDDLDYKGRVALIRSKWRSKRLAQNQAEMSFDLDIS